MIQIHKFQCYIQRSTILLKFYQPNRCFSCNRPLLKLCYFSKPSEEPLLSYTLGKSVDIAAEKYASREAYVVRHQNIRKNFVQFKKDVDELAAGLVALGLKKGNRIGMWSPNSYEWAVTQFATAKAGLILVCVNPAYQQRELEYCLKKVRMNAILCPETFKTQNYYQMLCSVVQSLERSKAGEVKDEKFPDFTHVIMISKKEHRGTYKYEDVLSSASKKDFEELTNLEKTIQFDDPVNIQFTSGTTGNPKGATLSHHNIVNNAYLFGKRHGYDLKPHRICIHMPMYHCMGNVIGTLAGMLHGAAIIFPSPTFKASITAQAVQDEKATSIYGTPTMYIDMLNLDNLKDYNLSSLETGTISGAPVSTELFQKLVDQLKISKMTVTFGCTETSPAIMQPKPIRKKTLPLLPSVEVKLVDDNNHTVQCGEPGEIWTRGYHVMLGYWDDEEKTDETITTSGWYKTGDIAIMDEEGNCQIVGRKKDMIIRGGENIYPREIEDFLHTHENIIDAQVIGVPDNRMGEELCAWIKLKTGATMTAENVKNFCKGKIAHFKIPKYILFVDEYPKTITGKVQKFEIRKQSIKLLNLQMSS